MVRCAGRLASMEHAGKLKSALSSWTVKDVRRMAGDFDELSWSMLMVFSPGSFPVFLASWEDARGGATRGVRR
eukprot:Skav236512  [mRNA]  locus=scaffold78:508529:508747:- [translate_table: standard]